MVFGERAPVQLINWTLAERFGWTLEYIDSLPEARLAEWFAIEDGKAHAQRSIIKR